MQPASTITDVNIEVKLEIDFEIKLEVVFEVVFEINPVLFEIGNPEINLEATMKSH